MAGEAQEQVQQLVAAQQQLLESQASEGLCQASGACYVLLIDAWWFCDTRSFVQLHVAVGGSNVNDLQYALRHSCEIGAQDCLFCMLL
jgi:hypothetical protein